MPVVEPSGAWLYGLGSLLALPLAAGALVGLTERARAPHVAASVALMLSVAGLVALSLIVLYGTSGEPTGT